MVPHPITDFNQNKNANARFLFRVTNCEGEVCIRNGETPLSCISGVPKDQIDYSD
jgi:hypothetical protein